MSATGLPVISQVVSGPRLPAPPSALPVVLWGPVGPSNAPRAGHPECPAQAASWASRVPFQPDAYLVLAVPAHDQVILVTACRMLGGQAEAAVPWQREGQRVGELHWAGRGVQAGGMHQLEAKRGQGATLGPHTHIICTKFRSCPLTWSP